MASGVAGTGLSTLGIASVGTAAAAAVAGGLYVAWVVIPRDDEPVAEPAALVQPAEPAAQTETAPDVAGAETGSEAESQPTPEAVQPPGGAGDVVAALPETEAAPEVGADTSETPEEAVLQPETPETPGEDVAAAAEPAGPILDAPGFDVVRVEPDGSTLVAGTGTPGSVIAIRLDGVELDRQTVDGSGKFVSFLFLEPSDQIRILTLLAELGEEKLLGPDQIILAPAPAPVVAEAEPEAAQVAEVEPAAEAEAEVAAGTEAGADTGAETVVAEASESSVAQAEESVPAQSVDETGEVAGIVSTETGTGTGTETGDQVALLEQVPEDVTEAGAAAVEDAVEESAAAAVAVLDQASEALATEETASAEAATEDTVSAEVATEDTVSAEVATEDTVSAEAATEDTVSAEAAVEETASAEVAVEDAPSEAAAVADVAVEDVVVAEAAVQDTPVTQDSAAGAAEVQDAVEDSAVAGGETELTAAEPAVETGEVAASVDPATPVAETPVQAEAAQQDSAEAVTESAVTEPAVTEQAETVVAEATEEAQTVVAAEPDVPAPRDVQQAVVAPDKPDADVSPAAVSADPDQPKLPGSNPITVLKATSDGVEVLQTGTAARPDVMGEISLDTISYSEAGDVQLSGRARLQSVVRIYLDNHAIAELKADDEGRWRGVLDGIEPGVYTLRLDEVDALGQVVSRIETPFKREAPEALAAVQLDTAPGRQFSGAVTVQKGDTLWAISRESYGEGILYVRLFQANRDRIRNPDLIYPGQVFSIPN